MVPENYLINFTLNSIGRDLLFLFPESFLLVLFLVLFFLDVFFKNKNRFYFQLILLLGILFSTALNLTDFFALSDATPRFLFSKSLTRDHVSAFSKVLFDGVTFVFIFYQLVITTSNREEQKNPLPDFNYVLLFLLMGLHFLAMANNLLSLYVSLEIVSLAGYAAVGFGGNNKSYEASIKYLLFGAFSSGLMLYGISLIYGLSGNLEFNSVLNMNHPFHYVASVLMLSGVLFKISAIPFHIWAPDVYEGASTPFTSFLSTAPKAGGFIVLCRIIDAFLDINHSLQNTVAAAFGIIALLTITIGNFSALWQQNAKRMLAYSAIAHSGFLLVGIAAMSGEGIRATLFYLFIYIFMNLVAFLMVDFFADQIGSEDVHNFKGIGMQVPFLAIIFVINMIALTGLPPTAGFYSKFLIFSALWKSYTITSQKFLLVLLSFGLINSVISLFYYLKIPYLMFFKKSEIQISFKTNYKIPLFFSLLSVPVLVLFFKPELLMNYINYLFS